MVGLLIKLAILFGIVFGVAYGATRALRSSRELRAIAKGKKARDDILALRAAKAEGVLDDQEYEKMTREIYEYCARQRIEIPDLD